MAIEPDTEPLDYDTVPLGEEVGPFRYLLPPDFNDRRLPTLGVHDKSCLLDVDGREVAEPSVLCGQHTWTLRRRFHWFGSVHAKCEIEYLLPVHVGSAIEVRSVIAEKYERRGGRYVVFLLETRRADGELACRVRNTMLLNFAEVQARRRQEAATRGAAAQPAPAVAAPGPLAAGAALVAGPLAFERQAMIDFFASDESVYGPHPSIHNDAGIAAKIGLGDIIAPGRYGIALMNGALLRLLGPAGLRGARYEVSILNNLVPGMRALAEARAAAAGQPGSLAFDCRDEVSGRMLLSGRLALGA